MFRLFFSSDFLIDVSWDFIGKKHAATNETLIFTYSRMEYKHSKKRKQKVQITANVLTSIASKFKELTNIILTLYIKKSSFSAFNGRNVPI